MNCIIDYIPKPIVFLFEKEEEEKQRRKNRR